MMARIWPFKKKAAEPEGLKVVEYDGSEDTASETLADRSHVEDDQFKAALDLLTNPHLGAPEGGEATGSTVVEVDGSEKSNFEKSEDGYYYRKNSDGSFDPKAHTKNDDGTYSPYSG
mgnify:CR=1 FL=1